MRSSPRSERRRLRDAVAAFRGVLSPRRRIRFTQGGAIFTVGTLAIGLAGINTGNNLLYLLLGAMLAFIGVSGWLSERVLRGLEVRRRTPAGTSVGRPVRIAYEVFNRKRRVPTLALQLSERGLPESAFISSIRAGATESARSENVFRRRGVYPLPAVTLSTTFPFGLFRKERDVELADELVIWPSTERTVAEPTLEDAGTGDSLTVHRAATGARGEYRGLREYRGGDDSRDIHWRSTARLGHPVVREYERDDGRTLWICLDTRNRPGDHSELLVDKAAALSALASRRGYIFGLAAGTTRVSPGSGPIQLERVLDALARVDFRPDNPPLSLPGAPGICTLVRPETA
ncbi:MAG: DUF58 domain-containing protein [Gemmatimonadota bacterium]